MTNSLWRKRQEPEALKLALEALEMYCEHGAILKPIETRDAIKETLAQPEHDLYTDADKDKPNAICDRNGQVALAMCKKCGKAEIELDEPCVKPQPEQEPVAVVDVHEFYDNCANFSLLQKLPKGKHTLYTAPPQRTWVGLTDEDEIDWEEGGNLKDLVKAIEAKLKEKNNG